MGYGAKPPEAEEFSRICVRHKSKLTVCRPKVTFNCKLQEKMLPALLPGAPVLAIRPMVAVDISRPFMTFTTLSNKTSMQLPYRPLHCPETSATNNVYSSDQGKPTV